MKKFKKATIATICVTAAILGTYKTYDAYCPHFTETNLVIDVNIEALSSGEAPINPKWYEKIINGISYLCTLFYGTETCVENPNAGTHNEWMPQSQSKTEYMIVNGKEIPKVLYLYKCEEVGNTETKTQNECDKLGELKWV